MSVDPQSQPEPQPQGLTSNHETPLTEKKDTGQIAGVDVGLMVSWDEPADQEPTNPLNWSVRRRRSIAGMVSFVTSLM